MRSRDDTDVKWREVKERVHGLKSLLGMRSVTAPGETVTSCPNPAYYASPYRCSVYGSIG